MSADPFVQYRVNTLYHFCDRRNLALIRELGGLYSLDRLESMNVTVPAPGGNDWSHDADRLKGLHKFVHLCPRPTHPMEFRAKEEGRIVDSIFLHIHPDVLQSEGVMICDDVSNKAGVVIHPLSKAADVLDFEVLFKRTDWTNPAIQARLQKAEKSEILVPDFIPLALIRNFPHD